MTACRAQTAGLMRVGPAGFEPATKGCSSSENGIHSPQHLAEFRQQSAALQGAGSTIGLPCGVERAARSHSSLRTRISANVVRPFSAASFSSAASQYS